MTSCYVCSFAVILFEKQKIWSSDRTTEKKTKPLRSFRRSTHRGAVTEVIVLQLCLQALGSADIVKLWGWVTYSAVESVINSFCSLGYPANSSERINWGPVCVCDAFHHTNLRDPDLHVPGSPVPGTGGHTQHVSFQKIAGHFPYGGLTIMYAQILPV